jgi:hypothetical protein
MLLLLSSVLKYIWSDGSEIKEAVFPSVMKGALKAASGFSSTKT